jgi:VWFA-related protein
MAIVSFDGRNLQMLSSWSQDDVELRRVISKSLADPAYGLRRLSERRQFDYERVLGVTSAVLTNSLEVDVAMRTHLDPNERYYVSRLSQQVERSVAAASATLRSFAEPPGRKVMLLLNGGWPLLPAEFVLNDISRYVIDREILAGEPLFRPLIDTANLLGYTIYPVDVPGLASQTISAELTAAPRVDSIGSSALGNSFNRESGVHAALHYLARQTGGRAMINAERIRAFETVVGDTRSYYWLGFSPTRGWDNRRHDVEIKTSNPSLRLRARQGFLDSSRSREVSMAVESALLFGGPTGDDLLKVGFGEPQPAGRGKIAVPIEILVPLDQLTFLPAAEGLAAGTELRLGVVDDNGARSEIPIIPVTFRLPAAPRSRTYAKYETTLKVRRGPHRAVVAIYDLASGRILSAAADFEF